MGFLKLRRQCGVSHEGPRGLREPLVWRQENPVFHSSCEGELGVALESLQGKGDLI